MEFRLFDFNEEDYSLIHKKTRTKLTLDFIEDVINQIVSIKNNEKIEWFFEKENDVIKSFHFKKTEN